MINTEKNRNKQKIEVQVGRNCCLKGRYIYYIIEAYIKTFLSSVEGRVDRGNKVCISIILINVGTRNQISINREKKISEVTYQSTEREIGRNFYLKGIKVCISFILMNFRYHKSNINQQREEEKQKKTMLN